MPSHSGRTGTTRSAGDPLKEIEGEDDASCHREALAWEVREAEGPARRGDRQGRDGRAGLWGGVRLDCDGGGCAAGLGGEGLQARHREQAGAALQEAGLRPVGIAIAMSISNVDESM